VRPAHQDAEVTDADDVRAANESFYAAFEARDLDAMAEVWERSDRVSVTHPGWPTLRGWARVAGSWQAIFSATPFIQFVLTDEEVLVDGEMAIVTLDENILQSGGAPPEGDAGELAGARVATTNVFVRRARRWQMVNHHGSPVYRDVP
jgi:ketosteroid isomerase-like protein